MNIEYDAPKETRSDWRSAHVMTPVARAEIERLLRAIIPPGGAYDKINMSKGGVKFYLDGAVDRPCVTAPYLNIWFDERSGTAGRVKLSVQAHEWCVLYEVLADVGSPLAGWIVKRIEKLLKSKPKEADKDMISGLKIAARQWSQDGALMKRLKAILLAHEIAGHYGDK